MNKTFTATLISSHSILILSSQLTSKLLLSQNNKTVIEIPAALLDNDFCCPSFSNSTDWKDPSDNSPPISLQFLYKQSVEDSKKGICTQTQNGGWCWGPIYHGRIPKRGHKTLVVNVNSFTSNDHQRLCFYQYLKSPRSSVIFVNLYCKQKQSGLRRKFLS